LNLIPDDRSMDEDPEVSLAAAKEDDEGQA
jgi:hypothetical protein